MGQPKNFGFGEDEQMVRDQARRFLSERSGIESLRKLVASDPSPERPIESLWDREAWAAALEIGWTALAVPEAQGGVGMSLVTVAALSEEVGRRAFPSPLQATLLSTMVLRACGTDAANEALGQIAEGRTASLAITNAAGSWAATDTDTAVADGALSGTACFVQDAAKVDSFVVSARSDAGVGLYLVAADAEGVSVTLDRIVDLTRDQARVGFDGAKAIELAAPGSGDAALDAAGPAIWTILAADMTGAAEWQLQTTAEYAKTRTQFGRAIGFFQAVKHPIVDVMIEIDKAKSLTYAAACAIDTAADRPQDIERLSRMAKAQAAVAAGYASDRSVQLHGGIGFTWECDLHIYFKRQKHSEALFGDAAYHRRRLADLMIGPIDG